MTKEVMRDFVVESKGHCFFCLDSITPSLSKLSLVHPLQYFSRYLKLEMRKVFTEEGTIPPNLLANVKRSKLKVELCSECTKLSDTFSGQCGQLERIKLETLSSMQIIYGKLLKGEESRREGPLPLLGDSSHEWAVKLGIMEALRGDAIQKCAEKLNNARPRVKIRKLTMEQVLMEKKVSVDVPSSSHSIKIEYDEDNTISEIDIGQGHPHSSTGDVKEVIKTDPIESQGGKRGSHGNKNSNSGAEDQTMSDSNMDSLSSDEDASECNSRRKARGRISLKNNQRKPTAPTKQNLDSPSNFRLKCPDCELLFQDVKGILLHRKNSESCGASHDPSSPLRTEVLVPSNNIRTIAMESDYTNLFAVIDLPQAIFLCGECDQAVFSSEDMLEHQKLHSSSQSNLSMTLNEPKCAICKTNSNSLRDQELAHHLKSRHDLTNVSEKNIKRCTVDKCGAYYLTPNQLGIHLKLRHQLAKSTRKGMISRNRNKCQDCGKTFALPHGLRRHRLQHHIPLDKAIPCSFKKCSKIFESQDELDWHIQHSATFHKSLDHRDKAAALVKCHLCKRSFNGSDPRYLKIHMKTHVTSKNDRYSCEIRGHEINENLKLQKHYEVHAGPGSWKFSCDICSKRCPSQPKLKLHMRVHTKETPYVCEICGVKYGYAHSLRAHMSSKHK